MQQQWFHVKSLNLTINLNHVKEINWEMRFEDLAHTLAETDEKYHRIYDASDRVALRKLIVGDDWTPSIASLPEPLPETPEEEEEEEEKIELP